MESKESVVTSIIHKNLCKKTSTWKMLLGGTYVDSHVPWHRQRWRMTTTNALPLSEHWLCTTCLSYGRIQTGLLFILQKYSQPSWATCSSVNLRQSFWGGCWPRGTNGKIAKVGLVTIYIKKKSKGRNVTSLQPFSYLYEPQRCRRWVCQPNDYNTFSWH